MDKWKYKKIGLLLMLISEIIDLIIPKILEAERETNSKTEKRFFSFVHDFLNRSSKKIYEFSISASGFYGKSEEQKKEILKNEVEIKDENE